jgi:hypothetical protein
MEKDFTKYHLRSPNLSSQDYRSKADLLMKIKQITPLLNGRYLDGSKGSFESGFKYARYAVILFAAISLPSFSYHTRKIGNASFASYYNLYKVAKVLRINYERNRAASNAYDELARRRHVKVTVENNRTYITFTPKGKRNCEEILDDLQLLSEHFNTHPLVQQRNKEGEPFKGTVVKGARSKSLLDIEADVDRLIKKISSW